MKKSVKPWYLSDALIQAFHSSHVRREWCETGAYEHFYGLERKLPADMRDRARVGAVFISEMTGTEGMLFWLFPVEGHKKILAPKSRISLFSKTGDVYYKGNWEGCSEELLLKFEEFYLWLKPVRIA